MEDWTHGSVSLSGDDGRVSGLLNEFERVEQEKRWRMKREDCEKPSDCAPLKVIVVKLP